MDADTFHWLFTVSITVLTACFGYTLTQIQAQSKRIDAMLTIIDSKVNELERVTDTKMLQNQTVVLAQIDKLRDTLQRSIDNQAEYRERMIRETPTKADVAEMGRNVVQQLQSMLQLGSGRRFPFDNQSGQN